MIENNVKWKSKHFFICSIWSRKSAENTKNSKIFEKVTKFQVRKQNIPKGSWLGLSKRHCGLPKLNQK